MAEEKPHKATKKKLTKLRGEGTVPRTPELTQCIALLGGVLGLFLVSDLCWERNKTLLHYCWLGSPDIRRCVAEGSRLALSYISGALFAAATVAVLVDAVQTGGIHWDVRPLRPRAERLNVASGMMRLGAAIRRSGWNLLEATVALTVSLWTVGRFVQQASAAAQAGVVGHGLELSRILFLSVPLIGVALGIVGVEVILRRRSFARQASMSTQELRDEYREEEGDPQLRAARKQLHRALTTAEMIRRVRQSRVLIVERRDEG